MEGEGRGQVLVRNKATWVGLIERPSSRANP